MNWTTTSLAALHTFALPAQATRYLELHTFEDIENLVMSSPDWNSIRILGGGSNTVFLEDQSMPIVRMCIKGRAVLEQDESSALVRAAAGENWDEFVAWSLEQGFYGLENLSLIPGTVGACPIQNIGAYGVEVCQCIETVDVFDPSNPTKGIQSIPMSECSFGYRDSKFKHEWSHLLITSVSFRLKKTFEPVLNYAGLTASASAKALRDEVIRLRQAKLPDPAKIPNAGSFFKNPVISKSQFQVLKDKHPEIPSFAAGDQIKVPAAWLLDQCGFKGQWHHEFGCYEKQPLVMIHNSTKTNPIGVKKKHFLEWLSIIQDKVEHHFGILLLPEPDLVFTY
ncbi:MAG: UDP-N-acetylmuramate dehydrogenase [Pseudomonadota bacterium]|nr:UDP-N-acetylmuramate dehydrogenase [Pseudomonadota bacterium]